MKRRVDPWDDYFYPETIESPMPTLKNKAGIRNWFDLRQYEYGKTQQRDIELFKDPDLVPRTHDAEHLRHIHRYLFQDVYEWAGEYRLVNMGKVGKPPFADCHNGDIEAYLTAAQRAIADTDWGSHDREEFGANIANVYALVNQAHPFREGNGRAAKLFVQHVAEQTPFALDYSKVDPDTWNRTSEASRPQGEEVTTNPEAMAEVFAICAVDRESSSQVEENSHTPEVASVLSLSYPKPATEATRSTPGQEVSGSGAKISDQSQGLER